MASRQGRICEVCGKQYNASCAAQRTCSRSCGAVVRARYSPQPKAQGEWPVSQISYLDCAVCGTLIVAHHQKIYCSPPCRETGTLANRRADKAWGNPKRTPPPTPCERCQQTMVSHPRRQCDGCRDEVKRARKQRDKRRRRALKLGVAAEPYTLAEIAQRDRYRCGLCRRKVPMDRRTPDPLAPTIDHVVPLSRQGDDTRANVQLAHFICNSTKGAGGGQQLALVG